MQIVAMFCIMFRELVEELRDLGASLCLQQGHNSIISSYYFMTVTSLVELFFFFF